MDYLASYAAGLDVEIRVNTRVETVTAEGRGFAVHTCDGQTVRAAGVVAATGSFSNPHRPALAGQGAFTGELLHVASYREPKSYAGKRVVVVGGGDSAVQVAHELAEAASVTLATRAPLRFLPQQVNGRDQHYWLATTGFDLLPPAWLARILTGPVVMETGPFQEALRSGRMDRRPMFAGLAQDQVIWADGSSEHVDVVLLATGYRPSLAYLHDLRALDAAGRPLHSGGISTTHPGLVYLGLSSSARSRPTPCAA